MENPKKDIVRLLGQAVELLMDMNPVEGSPEFALLISVADALDAYERYLFPNLTTDGLTTKGVDPDYPS